MESMSQEGRRETECTGEKKRIGKNKTHFNFPLLRT